MERATENKQLVMHPWNERSGMAGRQTRSNSCWSLHLQYVTESNSDMIHLQSLHSYNTDEECAIIHHRPSLFRYSP